MEDLPVKAIVIGVSVFVTMAVVSALMIYFNTAIGVSDAVNNRIDIAETYDNIMNADVFSDTLTGVQVRSLINKYSSSDSVSINIISINGKSVTEYNNIVVINGASVIEYNNINNVWRSGNGLIREELLDIVNPVWNCRVDKVQKNNKTILEISLNVDNTKED